MPQYWFINRVLQIFFEYLFVALLWKTTNTEQNPIAIADWQSTSAVFGFCARSISSSSLTSVSSLRRVLGQIDEIWYSSRNKQSYLSILQRICSYVVESAWLRYKIEKGLRAVTLLRGKQMSFGGLLIIWVSPHPSRPLSVPFLFRFSLRAVYSDERGNPLLREAIL